MATIASGEGKMHQMLRTYLERVDGQRIAFVLSTGEIVEASEWITVYEDCVTVSSRNALCLRVLNLAHIVEVQTGPL